MTEKKVVSEDVTITVHGPATIKVDVETDEEKAKKKKEESKEQKPQLLTETNPTPWIN